MKQAVIYSTNTCPYCVAAKSLLSREGYSFIEHNVSSDQEKYSEMLQLSRARTVPQIVIDNEHIGGYTDLLQHFSQAKKI